MGGRAEEAFIDFVQLSTKVVLPSPTFFLFIKFIESLETIGLAVYEILDGYHDTKYKGYYKTAQNQRKIRFFDR